MSRTEIKEAIGEVLDRLKLSKEARITLGNKMYKYMALLPNLNVSNFNEILYNNYPFEELKNYNFEHKLMYEDLTNEDIDENITFEKIGKNYYQVYYNGNLVPITYTTGYVPNYDHEIKVNDICYRFDGNKGDLKKFIFKNIQLLPTYVL